MFLVKGSRITVKDSEIGKIYELFEISTTCVVHFTPRKKLSNDDWV